MVRTDKRHDVAGCVIKHLQIVVIGATLNKRPKATIVPFFVTAKLTKTVAASPLQTIRTA
jgi:hypothetical protein